MRVKCILHTKLKKEHWVDLIPEFTVNIPWTAGSIVIRHTQSIVIYCFHTIFFQFQLPDDPELDNEIKHGMEDETKTKHETSGAILVAVKRTSLSKNFSYCFNKL